MKNILPLFLGLLFSVSLMAQNNSVTITSKVTGDTLNGTVYTIYGDGARPEIKEEFKAVMTSQDSMLVGIKRTEIKTIDSTFDFFCWFICYNPVKADSIPVWYATDSLWMYQDSVVTNFSVYLWPEGKMGQAQYRYTFYPENNPSDSSWLDVLFDIVSVGIEDVQEESVSMYPNPASHFLTVDIQSSVNADAARAEMYDINGKLMLTHRLNEGMNRIELNNGIKSGTYIVRLYEGNRVIFSKPVQISR